jgi:hypothetical protein
MDALMTGELAAGVKSRFGTSRRRRKAEDTLGQVPLMGARVSVKQLTKQDAVPPHAASSGLVVLVDAVWLPAMTVLMTSPPVACTPP